MLTSGFGGFHGPIVLDDLLCDGSESSLLDCRRAQGSHQCTNHSQDAGVKCLQDSQCEEQSMLLVSMNEWTAEELYLREGDLLPFDFINDEVHREGLTFVLMAPGDQYAIVNCGTILLLVLPANNLGFQNMVS